jgi:hypothetical protein
LKSWPFFWLFRSPGSPGLSSGSSLASVAFLQTTGCEELSPNTLKSCIQHPFFIMYAS